MAQERTASQRSVFAIKQVGAPFPDVAAGIEQAESVSFARTGIDRSRLPIRFGSVRKLPAKYVATRHATGIDQFAAPGKSSASQTAARGSFPLRFVGQPCTAHRQ